jgi:GNAT superfamily N-acetyltransferase
MKLVEIDQTNQQSFFNCLCPDSPGLKKIARERENWYREFYSRGYRAKLLLDERNRILGKCHYIPIEYSPLIGKDILVILCIYVHMHNVQPGDQRGRGYGRYMISEIEKTAKREGCGGVATWAMDWHWNPMSFYIHMGYVESDRIDKAVVLWKPFHDILPPRFIRQHPMDGDKSRVNVMVCDNAWCDGYEKLHLARKAVKEVKDIVDYYETICPCHGRMLHLGHVGGIFLDGEPYRPLELPGKPADLRNAILEKYRNKVK